jgi:uncharacterized protein YndB with AHSA1/START domain
MAELILKRHFAASPERVFEFVSKSEHLLTWWGPEAMFVPEGKLDFTATGPWFSVMQNEKGEQFKVSGMVVAVHAPKSLAFTWAWHDAQDRRGVETHVQFKVDPHPEGGSDFTLTHSEFKDTESMGNHEGGWTSSLRKLAANFN